MLSNKISFWLLIAITLSVQVWFETASATEVKDSQPTEKLIASNFSLDPGVDDLGQVTSIS
ncbi:MAG: hypothetical protein KME23_26470 [Goleter apudmare HA4340-LM2]|jgi:hypothetical protein|nr:hypothetical protein [Goleter apudmare HA4340-LM2]